ncbi:COG0212 5-formyltetrahydrofolate cyclo-ligase [Candidatus Nanopelagicaceae bacterium]
MGINEEKAALRTRYRHERHERYVEHSFEFLADLKEIHSCHIVASYISYGDEPDTSELNKKIIESGKVLLLPRIIGENLEWVAWDGDQSTLQLKKKILEPTGNIYTGAPVEAVIVPALRIDRSGYRLGQGGGYYDRYLATTKAWSIGLIHPDEISSEDLPRQEWDIPLRAAATPDLVVRF